jgi:uncharacterized membrane protein YsdA (DUF1294 family)
MKHIIFALAAFYLIMSTAAYIAYGRDKRLAKEHNRRTPEKVLLSLSFFGGAAGALAAMQLFRHKTKHWYFYAVGIIGLLWQAGLLIFLILSLKGGNAA